MPAMARGGMLPSFAGGGLFVGHGGEYVLQKTAVDSLGASRLDEINRSGKLPSGGTMTQVTINGDITPRQPNMTPEQVVQVVAKNINDGNIVAGAIKVRLMRNNGGAT